MSERSLTVVADSVRASIGCRLGAFTNEDASTVNHEGINRTNCLFNLVGVREGGKLPPLGTVADSVRASLGCRLGVPSAVTLLPQVLLVIFLSWVVNLSRLLLCTEARPGPNLHFDLRKDGFGVRGVW